MKILHVSPTYFGRSSVIGGGERYVSNLCKALNSYTRIIKSDIVTFSNKPLGQESLYPRTDLRLVPCQNAKPADSNTTFISPDITECFAEYDFVHIHACLSEFGLFAAAHARLLGKKVIGTDHGGCVTQLFTTHPFLFESFDVLHAQSVFAASAFLAASIDTRIIKGPVDDDKFTLSQTNRDRRRLVAVGRILPHKGFEVLIEALPDECVLTIIGSVSDLDYLDYLRSISIKKQIKFCFDLDDVGLLASLGGASLALHGSVSSDFRGNRHAKAELLGLSPLEFMATGLPVLCSETAALRELRDLRGCRTYRDIDDLKHLLSMHVAGSLSFPSPEIIRKDVVDYYGLNQFADSYTQLLSGLDADTRLRRAA